MLEKLILSEFVPLVKMDTNTQHDWFLFLLVNGLVGAVNPGVCAQVSETHVRVPEKRIVLVLSSQT